MGGLLHQSTPQLQSEDYISSARPSHQPLPQVLHHHRKKQQRFRECVLQSLKIVSQKALGLLDLQHQIILGAMPTRSNPTPAETVISLTILTLWSSRLRFRWVPNRRSISPFRWLQPTDRELKNQEESATHNTRGPQDQESTRLNTRNKEVQRDDGQQSGREHELNTHHITTTTNITKQNFLQSSQSPFPPISFGPESCLQGE